jgi:predicted secreted protein
MSWTSGVVLYILIWWVALFAVLPIGTRPHPDADATSGWRGAPARPRLARALLLTTIVSAVIWVIVALVIASEVFSFRVGLLAPHRP